MGDMLKGDERAPSVDTSTAQRIAAETKYLPGLIQAISGQILPSEQAIQNASNIISPQQQALNAQLYATYAPQYANVQSQAQAGADLNAIQGAGGQAALAAQALQRQIDPEFYAQRANISNKLSDLLNNPISGSEQAAIERANAQNALGGGRLGLNTNQQTISNAMNFGQAGRDRLGQALQLATNSLPALKSGTDTFAQATGRGGTNANAVSQNQLGATNLGQSAFGTGNAMQGQVAGLQGNQQNIDANRRSVSDYVNQAYGSATGVCCWIFMESYNGKMPHSVRVCRDYFYFKEPRLSKGYKRMATWLVPLMQKYQVIRWLVDITMIKPCTSYGEYLIGNQRITMKQKLNKMILKGWFMIWRLYA